MRETDTTPDGRTFDNRAGRAVRMERENGRLRTQLDQERQRRLHAEVLLREVRPMFDHIAGETGERIDKHFGEWDG